MCWLTMLLVHEVEELEDDVDVDDVAWKTCRLDQVGRVGRRSFFSSCSTLVLELLLFLARVLRKALQHLLLVS